MTSAALVGREREVQHLRTLIAGVEDRGGVLVLHGEAGVGKSTLVAEARRRAAASDMRVLATVGVESEQHLPYAGLHQLVFPVRSGIDNLPVSQRDALRAVTGLSDQQVPDIYLVGLAVLNLLAEVAAEAPLLLVAEDAHWLDQASVDVLTSWPDGWSRSPSCCWWPSGTARQRGSSTQSCLPWRSRRCPTPQRKRSWTWWRLVWFRWHGVAYSMTLRETHWR